MSYKSSLFNNTLPSMTSEKSEDSLSRSTSQFAYRLPFRGDANFNISVSESTDSDILTTFQKLFSQPIVSKVSMSYSAMGNGFPHEYRDVSWKMMLGYLPENIGDHQSTLLRKRELYISYIQRYDTQMVDDDEYFMTVIRNDVHRTHPDGWDMLLSHPYLQKSLERLLYVWSKTNEEVSYFQGLNDLASPFYIVFLTSCFGPLSDSNHEFINNTAFHENAKKYIPAIEADVFWCLTSLMTSLSDRYNISSGGVHGEPMVDEFKQIMEVINPRLVSHLDNMGITFFHFSFRWMLCFMMRELTTVNIIHLWDEYITRRDGFTRFHLYFCAAYLNDFAPLFMNLTDMGQVLMILQKLPSKKWNKYELDRILTQARNLFN
eukprot:TRINITY_DN5469_c0_g1_i1.p1 TRINITY_DN5469_c0_g1~~TRINITY_DN5469_c0_g1_i1.p1  ORF type:complete len:376 (+),score=68.43 TRINITY_DN5469_c0_g1_i1:52-1179(+)